MRRFFFWLVLGSLMFLVLGTSAIALAALAYEDRTFDATYPDIRASPDPATVERGRRLVYGAAHCVDCHGDPARVEHRASGEEIPLSGGFEWHLPLGTIRAPNITPDRQTGIGRYRDEELARVLRHGVGPDGRALLPFMPFADLSDEDLRAVISYVRTRPPVRHEVPRPDWNVLGTVVKAFVLEPTGPSRPIRSSVEVGPTVEYGRYLANDVGNCAGCHTQRDLRTGAYVGTRFAGGMRAESHVDPSVVFVSPNLTPDPAEGRLNGWTEDAFIARFRRGRLVPTSPMPWTSFSTMTDDELRAIYRYLKTLPPAPMPETRGI